MREIELLDERLEAELLFELEGPLVVVTRGGVVALVIRHDSQHRVGAQLVPLGRRIHRDGNRGSRELPGALEVALCPGEAGSA